MIPCKKFNEVTGNHIVYFYMYVHRAWTLYMHIKSSLVPRPPPFLFFGLCSITLIIRTIQLLFKHRPFPGQKINYYIPSIRTPTFEIIIPIS